MPRTARRGGPQTRARIRDVANRLFLDRGYDAVTVAEVAREAGVSSVTVFTHFPRKEDLFLDRADDATDLLRSAVRDREPGTDVLTSLHTACLQLIEVRHPLSGLDERSVPFFRTVAGSSALLARAREIAADLQRALTEELDAQMSDPSGATVLAAFVVAGYSAVLIETARCRMAGQPTEAVSDDHRARLEQLFLALRHGVGSLSSRP